MPAVLSSPAVLPQACVRRAMARFQVSSPPWVVSHPQSGFLPADAQRAFKIRWEPDSNFLVPFGDGHYVRWRLGLTWPVSTLWPSRLQQRGHECSLTSRVTVITLSTL